MTYEDFTRRVREAWSHWRLSRRYPPLPDPRAQRRQRLARTIQAALKGSVQKAREEWNSPIL